MINQSMNYASKQPASQPVNRATNHARWRGSPHQASVLAGALFQGGPRLASTAFPFRKLRRATAAHRQTETGGGMIYICDHRQRLPCAKYGKPHAHMPLCRSHLQGSEAQRKDSSCPSPSTPLHVPLPRPSPPRTPSSLPSLIFPLPARSRTRPFLPPFLLSPLPAHFRPPTPLPLPAPPATPFASSHPPPLPSRT